MPSGHASSSGVLAAVASPSGASAASGAAASASGSGGEAVPAVPGVGGVSGSGYGAAAHAIATASGMASKLRMAPWFSEFPRLVIYDLAVPPEPWRYEPLGIDRFALGEGPFRVRGLAYVAALAFVDKKLPGGRAAIQQLLAGDPLGAYFQQIFVPPGSYDVSPLLSLHLAAARAARKPPGRFIEERARASALHDARGMWKPLLATASVRPMAERLPLAYNRYFEPSQARSVALEPKRFDGELTRVPDCMSGLYVNATNGFVAGALELAGAANVRLDWSEAMRDGSISGVPTSRVRFSARWD